MLESRNGGSAVLRVAAFLLVAAVVAGGAPADEPIRLGPSSEEPRLVKFVRPEHPDVAKRAGLGGVVVIECTVNPDGRVADASALRGEPPLSEAAIKAVKKWRYEPLVVDGKPRAFIKAVQLNFISQETMTLDGLIESLSSQYEAVRASAAVRLGSLFQGRRLSRDSRWAAQELRKLLTREESPRVRGAAEDALVGMAGE
jgi:TonB family protein